MAVKGCLLVFAILSCCIQGSFEENTTNTTSMPHLNDSTTSGYSSNLNSDHGSSSTVQPTLATTTMSPTPSNNHDLQVPNHAFKLWLYVVIIMGTLLFISITFVVIVVSCSHCTEKKNKNKMVEDLEVFVPKTKQGNRRGVGTSVYSVKSQDEFLEMVDMSAEKKENTATDDEQEHTYEQLDRDTQESIISTAANSNETRRMTLQSEHEGAGVENAAVVVENNMTSSNKQDRPTTLDLVEGQGETEATIEVQEEELPPKSPPARRFTFEDGSVLQDYPISYDPEIGDDDKLDVKPPPNIYSSQILHELASPEQDDNVIPIEVDVIIEPELIEPELFSVPLDLPTVVIEEEGDINEPAIGKEWEAGNITDNIPVKTGANKAIELQIPVIECPAQHQSTEGLGTDKSLQPSSQQDNDLYAIPVITIKPQQDNMNLLDPATLFDDPNYMKGMLAQRGLLAVGGEILLEQSDITPADSENATETIPAIPPRQPLTSSRVTKQDDQQPLLELSSIAEITAVAKEHLPLHTKIGHLLSDTSDDLDPDETKVKGSTKSVAATPSPIDPLEWLGFEGDDIGELDADIADCLRQPF